MLNRLSRSRSEVGRISRVRGAASVRPRCCPPTMRISAGLPRNGRLPCLSLPPRPLGLAETVGPVAAGLLFVRPRAARFPCSVILRWPRFCAALEGCTAAACRLLPTAPFVPILGDPCRAVGLSRRFSRRLGARRLTGLVLDRPREIQSRRRGDAFAELLAQVPRAHLVDRALGQLAELERTERHPDQAVHRQPEMAEHVLHLAVLALAHREGEPHIGALLAVEPRLDRPVGDAVDFDAVLSRSSRSCVILPLARTR